MNLTDRRIRGWLLAFMLVGCVGCDQASKNYAIEHFKGEAPISYAGGLFRIQYAENPGAFLSLLANMSPDLRFWVLVVANSLVMAFVAGYLLWSKDLDPPSIVALSLIVAGGVGNLIDRLSYGVVIDFMNMGIGPVRTGVFNVADMAITAGFVLLLPQLFRREPEETAAPPEPAT